MSGDKKGELKKCAHCNGKGLTSYPCCIKKTGRQTSHAPCCVCGGTGWVRV